MTNSGSLTRRCPASIAAVESVLGEMRAVAESFETGAETCESIAGRLHLDLQSLAKRCQVSIDSQLAEDTCLALGQTLGLWLADGALSCDRASRRFICERMEDLAATIGYAIEAAVSERGARRTLTGLASLSSEELVGGEHFGDLFLATASVVAIAAAKD